MASHRGGSAAAQDNVFQSADAIAKRLRDLLYFSRKSVNVLVKVFEKDVESSGFALQKLISLSGTPSPPTGHPPASTSRSSRGLPSDDSSIGRRSSNTGGLGSRGRSASHDGVVGAPVVQVGLARDDKDGPRTPRAKSDSKQASSLDNAPVKGRFGEGLRAAWQRTHAAVAELHRSRATAARAVLFKALYPLRQFLSNRVQVFNAVITRHAGCTKQLQALKKQMSGERSRAVALLSRCATEQRTGSAAAGPTKPESRSLLGRITGGVTRLVMGASLDELQEHAATTAEKYSETLTRLNVATRVALQTTLPGICSEYQVLGGDISKSVAAHLNVLWALTKRSHAGCAAAALRIEKEVVSASKGIEQSVCAYLGVVAKGDKKQTDKGKVNKEKETNQQQKDKKQKDKKQKDKKQKGATSDDRKTDLQLTLPKSKPSIKDTKTQSESNPSLSSATSASAEKKQSQVQDKDPFPYKLPVTVAQIRSGVYETPGGGGTSESQLETVEPAFEIASSSDIVSRDVLRSLIRRLPRGYQVLDWTKRYSMHADGSSLEALRTRVNPHRGKLFLFKDSTGAIFGFFTPDPIVSNDVYYGSRETCVFRIRAKPGVTKAKATDAKATDAKATDAKAGNAKGVEQDNKVISSETESGSSDTKAKTPMATTSMVTTSAEEGSGSGTGSDPRDASSLEEPEVWHWAGANEAMLLINKESLTIGIDDPALQMDSHIRDGTSGPSATFGSERLSGSAEFIVHDLEVWVETNK